MKKKEPTFRKILEALVFEGPLTIEEIADKIGKHYTTALRRVNELVKEGCLIRSEESERGGFRYDLSLLGLYKVMEQNKELWKSIDEIAKAKKELLPLIFSNWGIFKEVQITDSRVIPVVSLDTFIAELLKLSFRKNIPRFYGEEWSKKGIEKYLGRKLEYNLIDTEISMLFEKEAWGGLTTLEREIYLDIFIGRDYLDRWNPHLHPVLQAFKRAAAKGTKIRSFVASELHRRKRELEEQQDFPYELEEEWGIRTREGREKAAS